MIPLHDACRLLFAHCAEQPTSRVVLGVAGAPGAGKSTAAAAVMAEAQRLGVSAVVVPMDGWHLAHSTLERLGAVHVKGAPHTFDAHGFVELVSRIRNQREGDATIWAPEFRREIEDAVAGAVEIRSDHRLVVVEGNYLLLDESPWSVLRDMVDVAWLLRPSEDVRHARLIHRHEAFGRSNTDARDHALGSDEVNARRVLTAHLPDHVIEIDPG